MRYDRIRKGIFLERPNRFVAYVLLDGRKEKVHVKNTGRCAELLLPGTEVYLEESGNPERTTAYDLVAVKKGDRIVNVDSSAPNKAVGEWLRAGGLSSDTQEVRAEKTFGKSRFDFWMKTKEAESWIEVKGVNLEEDNTALFPDAPSERALKHVYELIEAKKQGYGAVILFVVQLAGIRRFCPNRRTQPEFAEALIQAERAGVRILAMGCEVTPEEMRIAYEIPVVLEEEKSGPVHLEWIAPRLLPWYDKNRRSLPWRERAEPYRVWVSEIMLQQTRVEAVKPYFERFMEALPDIASLAAVPDERLLKLWEGLGYYSRARNLKRAACEVMERFGGRLPEDEKALLSLPGIGSYTAGAIASIAYGHAVPAVDGNVLRVLSRLCMDGRDMGNAKVKKEIEANLREIMPKERPGDFNQAMMELGATVCGPGGTPACGECPLQDICLAHREGKELNFPQKAPKKERIVEEHTVLVIQDGKRAAVVKRPDKGLLAGMYGLPSMEGERSREEVLSYLDEKGLKPLQIRKLPRSKHIFTHLEWHMTGYAVRVDGVEACAGRTDGLLFVDLADTEEKYPIPTAFSAYTKYLDIRIGHQKYAKGKDE